MQAGLNCYEFLYENWEWQEKTEPLRLEHFKFCKNIKKNNQQLISKIKFILVYLVHGIFIITSGFVLAVQITVQSPAKEEKQKKSFQGKDDNKIRRKLWKMSVFSCSLIIAIVFTILMYLMVEHELRRWDNKQAVTADTSEPSKTKLNV